MVIELKDDIMAKKHPKFEIRFETLPVMNWPAETQRTAMMIIVASLNIGALTAR